MSARDFIGLNGYSNRYWLWGKEDDDLYMRMLASNVSGWARPLADDLPRWAALGGARSLADVLSRWGLLTWPLGLWGAALGERLYQTIATCKHFVG